MTMWLVLACAIGVEVFGTLGLRASDGFRKKAWIVPVVAGLPGVLLSAVAHAWRSGMPIGIAYGVWTACGVALVAVIARYLFRDPLTPKMMIGIGLIVAGVLTIELAGVVH